MKVHLSIKDPSNVVHPWVFDFELVLFNQRTFSLIENFMNNWWWLSIPYAIFYIIIVFIGQTWMTKRNKKFELREALIAWNTFLAIFSFWGACRCVPELLYSLNKHGLQHSLCNPILKQGVTGLWLWLFIISKVPETIDTLFIVLRRQQLILLHWFHHASVLVYCFYR
jgi:elongation of very long chain fatty acids protein 6